MNVPLNQIYNYLEGLIGVNSTLIYRFDPPGSKKISSLSGSKPITVPWTVYQRLPVTVMHDQEPLNFDMYNQHEIGPELFEWFVNNRNASETWFTPAIYNELCTRNLGFVYHGSTTYDHNIIVHSEQRSTEIEKYRAAGLEGVYWWSHAMIARDWYRYAKIDPLLESLPNQYQLDFNIYNRAWSGTREYRLKFADLVIDRGLVGNCNITFNPVDSGMHYLDYVLKNQSFMPMHNLLALPANTASSTSSAEYSVDDYSLCWFDVVLETLFDDPRLHLTEKVLRPIACGKPFILAATHGSLNYLRSYGFKTFGDFIDESYDTLTNPLDRLKAIVDVMQQISALSADQKSRLHTGIKEVVAYNKRRFFSSEFFETVVQEFVDNFKSARQVCEKHNLGVNYVRYRKTAKAVPELKKILCSDDQYRSRRDLAKLLSDIRKAQGR